MRSQHGVCMCRNIRGGEGWRQKLAKVWNVIKSLAFSLRKLLLLAVLFVFICLWLERRPWPLPYVMCSCAYFDVALITVCVCFVPCRHTVAGASAVNARNGWLTLALVTGWVVVTGESTVDSTQPAEIFCAFHRIHATAWHPAAIFPRTEWTTDINFPSTAGRCFVHLFSFSFTRSLHLFNPERRSVSTFNTMFFSFVSHTLSLYSGCAIRVLHPLGTRCMAYGCAWEAMSKNENKKLYVRLLVVSTVNWIQRTLTTEYMYNQLI